VVRILVLSNSPAGEQMSAPGIRALNIARTLASHLPDAEVTLAIPNQIGQPQADGFRVVVFGRRTLPGIIRAQDVIVAQYVPAYALPFVLDKRLVLDFFANYIAEWLELSSERPRDSGRAAKLDANRRYLNLQLSQADLVLTANERQRDLWLGALAAIGRITPSAYDTDPSLRNLIDVAPFGVRPEPAVVRQSVLKGVYPGIDADDRVLIWNGGIVRWYDAGTLLQAIARIASTRSDVKLLFLGTKYPVADPIEGETLRNVLALSDALGLTGSSVFFNEGWLPYDATADYLVEADAGVCSYFDNLETHFAHRVRLVDLIWAETPIVCNQGDVIGQLVAERGLGLSVPPGDVTALAGALVRVLDDAACRSNCVEAIRAYKRELSWENCLRPLIDFCQALPAPSPSRSSASTAAFGLSYAWGRLVQQARML
jgi:glycosyltransferase involved in cell wall biosynthesis